MENWAAIADEAAAAIASVGFTVTLEKPGTLSGPEWAPIPGPPAQHPMVCIDETIDLKDSSGTLTGKTMRRLTVAAVGVAPGKGDRVLVRGAWHEIIQVKPTAPGGVDLIFELELAS
jgi:hypothetical protein